MGVLPPFAWNFYIAARILHVFYCCSGLVHILGYLEMWWYVTSATAELSVTSLRQCFWFRAMFLRLEEFYGFVTSPIAACSTYFFRSCTFLLVLASAIGSDISVIGWALYCVEIGNTPYFIEHGLVLNPRFEIHLEIPRSRKKTCSMRHTYVFTMLRPPSEFNTKFYYLEAPAHYCAVWIEMEPISVSWVESDTLHAMAQNEHWHCMYKCQRFWHFGCTRFWFCTNSCVPQLQFHGKMLT